MKKENKKTKRKEKESNLYLFGLIIFIIGVALGLTLGAIMGNAQGEAKANEELNAFCEYSNTLADVINQQGTYHITKVDCTRYKIE